MAEPIRPEDVVAKKAELFPPEVIDTFNELIAAAFSGGSATVMQADAAEAIAGRLGVGVDDVYARHLLDVEEVYRAAGWLVTYEKPGFNESGQACFVFRPPSGKE